MSDDEINKIAAGIDPDPASDPTVQQRQELTFEATDPTPQELDDDETFDRGAYLTPGWNPPDWTPPDSASDPPD